MEKVGFAVIVNHGVDKKLITDLRAYAKKFFQKSLEVKQQYSRGPYGNGLGGYTGLATESVERSEELTGADAPTNLVESYIFHPSQEHDDEIRDVAGPYYEAMIMLLR